MSPAGSHRTLILGLLGELAGAGARFCTPATFAAAAHKHPEIDAAARAGSGAPHAVTVVVDAAPEAALPFARASAAIGVPVTFLLRMARSGASPRRHGGEASAELTALHQPCGVTVPAGTKPADLPAAMGGQRGQGVRLEVLYPDGDAVDPDEAAALHAAAGLPVCLGTTTIAQGHAVGVAFTVRAERGRLQARSTRGFEILASPLGAVDEVDVACLADTVARGPCLVGLRLSVLA